MDTTGRQAPFLGSKQATHGVYIEMVVLAVIIALEGKRSSDGDILLSLFGAVVAVVLAEFYAYYIGTMIGDGQDQLLAFNSRPHFDWCSRRSMSGRVQKKIIQGLLQKHKICAN